VHTAADVPEALAQVAALCPAVVLLDLSAGFDCSHTGELHAACHGSQVVVLGVEAQEEAILTCVEAGASGYLSLDGSLDDLVTTIRNVAQDRLPCSPSISAALARRVASLATEQGGWRRVRLTARECEVLKLVRRGMSNREIAASLDVCISTVKNHIHSILGKLNVATRSQAAASKQ
jgi:DNA-binding NarL/FixJ family response regulator